MQFNDLENNTAFVLLEENDKKTIYRKVTDRTYVFACSPINTYSYSEVPSLRYLHDKTIFIVKQNDNPEVNALDESVNKIPTFNMPSEFDLQFKTSKSDWKHNYTILTLNDLSDACLQCIASSNKRIVNKAGVAVF